MQRQANDISLQTPRRRHGEASAIAVPEQRDTRQAKRAAQLVHIARNALKGIVLSRVGKTKAGTLKGDHAHTSFWRGRSRRRRQHARRKAEVEIDHGYATRHAILPVEQPPAILERHEASRRDPGQSHGLSHRRVLRKLGGIREQAKQVRLPSCPRF